MTQLLFVHLAKTGGSIVCKILKASQANSFDYSLKPESEQR